MDLFKLLGTIAIDNSEANRALNDTSRQASSTADTVKKSNSSIGSSNKSTGSSWSNLKSKVNEYKSQGMSTSAAWRKANSEMRSSTESAGNGMVGAFSKIGAAVATYLTVDAIKDFGLNCVQAAADASAAESQFSQVFGNLEGKASKSLKGISDTAGISENRMKGSFTKIAAFAKTTGMGTEDALGLADRAMVAVADSAAFYDRSLEDTTESLQSFLKGNYENDSALGLSCTETTRNAAANKLYGKSFKDLSESQKQLTLLQMVEDANKTSGALGQAARESDTWTNQTGNLKQAWTDFQAVIGSKVLPTAVGVVKKMVGVVESWTAKLPSLIDWCKKHETIIKAIGIVVGSVAAAIGIYASGLTVAGVATTIMTAASSALAAVIGFITSPITLAVVAIGALVAAFVVAYNKSETFRGVIDKLKNGLVKGFNVIKDAATKVKDKLVGAWDSISAKCAPLVSAIKENLVGAFNDLKEAGRGLIDRLNGLKDKFQPIADFLSGAFSSAAGSASGWFDKLTEKAGDLASGALAWLNDKITLVREGFNKFADFAGRLWDNLDPLVTLIRDNLLSNLEKLGEPLGKIKDAFSQVGQTIVNDVFPALKEKFLSIWEKLKPILTVVAGIIGGVVATAFGLISGVINGVVSALSGFAQYISGIVQVVANVFDLIVGIFTGNGEKCKEALQGIWDGVCSVFGGLWDAVSGFLQGFVDGVVGFFKGLWDTLVGHSIVPDTINGVINCFGGLWEGVKGFVSGFVDNVTGFFTNLKDKAAEKFGELKDKAVEKFTDLKNKASEKWSEIKSNASEKWESIKSTVSEKASGLKDKASEAFSNLKDKVSNAASSAKEKASSAWDSLKEKTSSAFSTAKDKAASAFSSLKDKVSSTASSAKEKVSSAWSTLKEKTSSLFNSAKEKASSAFSTIKSKVSSYASSTAESAGSKFSSMKSKISSAVNSAKSTATSAFSTINSKISSAVSGAYSTVSSKFGNIKTKISSVMDSAKSTVSNAVTKLKSAFNFDWSLPKLKIPKISITGGEAPYGIGGAGSLPKFSITWHKDAMNNPMILTKPTVFSYDSATGKAQGAGEAGSELVGGTTTVMRMIESAVSSQNEGLIYYLERLIEILAEYFPQILEAMEIPRPAVFDTESAAAALAVPMNRQLGKLSSRKDRGR